MARKEKNIHYIYKTICNVTGKWYVGMHSTSNENDGYMGSGKRLRYSIRKHGVDNHTKEILEYCNSREELVLREIEIVNSDMIQDEMCMNLREGGTGGFRDEEHREKFLEGRVWGRILGGKKAQEILNENPDIRIARNLKTSKTFIDLYKNGWKNWNGKSHSEETKKLMSEQRKGQGSGETNSQYGSYWITNGAENKKIKKDDEIPDGWSKGRKIK